MKKLFTLTLIIASLLAPVALPLINIAPHTAFAADKTDPPKTTNINCGSGGVKLGTAIGGDRCVGSDTQNPIFDYLARLLKFLSGILGLLFVLIIIAAGVQYIISGGNSEETKSAKNRLKAAITGLLLFSMMYAILNFIIPGGLF